MGESTFFFESFEPGVVLGQRVEVYDETKALLWRQIFAQEEPGAGSAAEAASLALSNMMRAYLTVVAPRPPGNIHAKQTFRLHSPPRHGEALDVTVSCAGKEVRRGRNYLELKIDGVGAGKRPVFEGLATIIWAA